MKRVGITLGDPAGIGPEIVEASLKEVIFPKEVEYQIYGNQQNVVSGKPTRKSAKIALNSLEDSAKDLRLGKIDALATAPVSKANLQAIGFKFPGQTEFFADRLNSSSVMCMTGKKLTLSLATTHIALKEVVEQLTVEKIIEAGRLLAEFLKEKYPNIPLKLAVLSLNPHAGESGSWGDEEERLISPTIKKLNQWGKMKNIEFKGPYPSDSLFWQATQSAKSYHGMVCMYHDQGLIPFKLLEFEEGVNLTLGLPRPRTSPAHGTAFDLAGRQLANHKSMKAAINLCLKLIQN